MKTYGVMENYQGFDITVITDSGQSVGIVTSGLDYAAIVFLTAEEVDDLIVQLSEWLEKYPKGEVK